MNCYPILYSRSRGKDYRWILVPPFISQNDKLLLNNIYNIFDEHKESVEIEKAELPVIFYIHLSSSSLIAQCSKTKYKDKEGRVIYALQGLAAPFLIDSRDLWHNLPLLITNTQKYINPWQNINFDHADEITNEISKSQEIRPRDTYKNFTGLTEGDFPKLDKGHIELDFDNDGFKDLLGLLLSPRIPSLNFAFGFSKDLLTIAENFQIAAFIKPSSKKNILNPPIVRENIEKESFKPHVEFCDIFLTSCMVREFFGLRGNERLCFEARIDSEFSSRTIVRVLMSYPANQIDLINKSPTLEAEKALDDLRAKLKEDNWREIILQKKNWWGGRYQKQRDIDMPRRH